MTYAYDDGLHDAAPTGSAAEVTEPVSGGVVTGALQVIEDLTTMPSTEIALQAPVVVADRERPDQGDADPPPRVRRPSSAPPRRRLGGLDGLRAIAVLSVVTFHLDYALAPGGFLGVDVFFVISGFLITNLIATEILASGRLRLGRFYARRARRLLPTVLVLLVVVVIAGTTIWRDQMATLRGGVVSSLFYVTNWWLIADHQSYFVASGRPTMVQHLWSLAIEEQYYLIWSVVVMAVAGVVIVTRRRADPVQRMRLVVIVALVLAVGSTLAMAWYAVGSDLPYGGSTSRVYFGSDTHTMGLFLGSAAGAWLALRRQSARESVLGRRSRWWLAGDLVGLFLLGVVIYQFFGIDEFSPGLYRGGFLAFDVVVLATILSAVRTGSLFGRLLDMRPIRWLGVRSYAIYIWHWPVAVVTRPGLDVHGPLFLINTERLVLILGLSALSYRFVEVPLRTGAWRRWRSPDREAKRRGWQLATMVITALAAISLVVAAQPVQARPPVVAQPPAPVAFPSSAVTQPHTQPVTPPTHPTTQPAQHHATTPAPKPSLSAFGDSVLLGAQSVLRQHTAHLRLDAVEGRQAYDVLDDITSRAAAGRLEPDVLIHVGNNGIISPEQLKHTLGKLVDRNRVLLFNDRVPRDWQDPNNQIIRSVAKHFSNVVVVDWHSLSAGRYGWLYSDGIHLTPAGATAYTQIVLHALAK